MTARVQETSLIENALEAPVYMENIAEQRSGPGLLVLTSSCQIMHVNRQAAELIEEMSHRENGNPPTGELPSPISDLAAEIVKNLQVRTEAKDWEQFQMRRLVGDARRAILLRGFGLPDRAGVQQSRVVVIMEAVGRRQQTSTEQAKSRFQLTDREEAVVRQLAKGWTNKEIANSLGITEQTVKEHIKHIMQKTKTTTRTGILVQILRS